MLRFDIYGKTPLIGTSPETEDKLMNLSTHARESADLSFLIDLCSNSTRAPLDINSYVMSPIGYSHDHVLVAGLQIASSLDRCVDRVLVHARPRLHYPHTHCAMRICPYLINLVSVLVASSPHLLAIFIDNFSFLIIYN